MNEVDICDEATTRVNEETASRLKELVELEYECAIKRAELIRDIKLTQLNPKYNRPSPWHFEALFSVRP